MAYDPARPLISVHVPKTAGSSFRSILESWFGSRLAYHYPHVGNDCDEVWARASAEGGWCIHGHFHETGRMSVLRHYPGATQMITFVRDPLEVNLSYLHYVRDRFHNRGVRVASDEELERLLHVDVDEWVASGESMLIHSLPSGMDEGNYRDVLDATFLHVGVVEAMEESVSRLARLLGKPAMAMPRVNVTARTLSPGPGAVARFRERNRLAYLVHEYAMERNGGAAHEASLASGASAS